MRFDINSFLQHEPFKSLIPHLLILGFALFLLVIGLVVGLRSSGFLLKAVFLTCVSPLVLFPSMVIGFTFKKYAHLLIAILLLGLIIVALAAALGSSGRSALGLKVNPSYKIQLSGIYIFAVAIVAHLANAIRVYYTNATQRGPVETREKGQRERNGAEKLKPEELRQAMNEGVNYAELDQVVRMLAKIKKFRETNEKMGLPETDEQKAFAKKWEAEYLRLMKEGPSLE